MDLNLVKETEKNFTAMEIIKLVNLYFQGIFFKPVELATEPIKIPDEDAIRLLIEKEKFTPFLKDDTSLDLQKMSDSKLFEHFFPVDARGSKKDEADWISRDQRIHNEKKIGGVIRTFIEDMDDKFIERMEEQIPERNIKRNDDFSIPRDFFDNLIENKIYVICDEFDERGGEELYLLWNFEDMLPPLANVLKGQKKRTPIYRAYEWYAEREYTTLVLGTTLPEKENDLYKLRMQGKKYCEDEIIKSYIKEHPRKNPDADLFFVICKMLERPHGEPQTIPKTLEELWSMVSKELNHDKYDGPLEESDINDISNAAEAVQGLLSEKDQDTLDAYLRDSKIDAARFLLNLFSMPYIKEKFPDNRRTETLQSICIKIDESKFSLNIPVSIDDERGMELIEYVGDTKYKNIVDSIIDDFDIEFLEKYFKPVLLEAFESEFYKEKDFLSFIREKSWREIIYLLYPFRKERTPTTDSELFINYCRIEEMDFQNQKFRTKFSTDFRKRIKRILIKSDKKLKKKYEEEYV